MKQLDYDIEDLVELSEQEFSNKIKAFNFGFIVIEVQKPKIEHIKSADKLKA